MASTRKTAFSMGIVFLTMQLLWAGGSRAQSSDCGDLLPSLSSCLAYINGRDSTPANSCCTSLQKVLHSSPMCLCQILNGGSGISDINQTRALELPAACGFDTPPASRCNATSPSAPPGGSPVPATPSSPGTGSSDGSSIKASTSLLLFFFSSSFFIMAAPYSSSGSIRY